MSQHSIQVSTSINKSPEEVIAFLADVRNRQKYQQSLSAVSDIEGEPTAVGSSWKWKWEFAGQPLEGTAECVEYSTGQKYAFVTAGGVDSRFEYLAAPDGEGTNLTIRVEFEIPAALASAAQAEAIVPLAQQKGEESIGRLKELLESGA